MVVVALSVLVSVKFALSETLEGTAVAGDWLPSILLLAVPVEKRQTIEATAKRKAIEASFIDLC